MDLVCPKCGEPWDMDELHEVEGLSWKEAYRQFRLTGCAVFGCSHGELLSEKDRDRAAVSGMLMDLLGDDVDGVASELDLFDGFGG